MLIREGVYMQHLWRAAHVALRRLRGKHSEINLLN